MSGTILTVAGCKGGVGKTTTSINLGTAMARAGNDVLLIETDIAMANVADFLSLDFAPDRDPSLHDILAGDAVIVDAIYDAPGGLSVLPSGTTLEGYVKTDIERIGAVVDAVRDEFDIVILDTPAGISRETLLPLSLADKVILVSTPRLSAVRDVEKTGELVKRLDGEVLGLVLTHTGTGNAPPSERIAEFLGIELLGSIPEDTAIPASQDVGRAVVSYAPSTAPAQSFIRITAEILERIGRLDDQSPTLSNGATS